MEECFAEFLFYGLARPGGLTGPAPKPLLSSIGDLELLLNTHFMLAQCVFGAGLVKAQSRPTGPCGPAKQKLSKKFPHDFCWVWHIFFFWLSMLSFSLCLTLKKLVYIFHPNFVIFSWGGIANFCSVWEPRCTTFARFEFELKSSKVCSQNWVLTQSFQFKPCSDSKTLQN